MQIVPIPPTKNIPDFSGYPWQFCLAHIAKDNPEYLKQYKWLGSTGAHKIILDNGAFETGQSDNFLEVWQIAQKIWAYEIVLPDRMFMADDTISMVKKTMEWFKDIALVPGFNKVYPDYNPQFQAVIHGRNIREWRDCAKELASIPGIKCLAIPKDYEAWDGGRDILLDLLVQILVDGCGDLSHEIHLLGMEKDPLAFRKFNNIHNVRTMDTAKPFIWAHNDYQFGWLPASRDSIEVKFRRPENYFQDLQLGGINLAIAHKNMEIWQDAARAH